ncbi:MAG: hypothetical protein KGM42_17615, partial [Hyphomicrobiales bacterium]|nr:hypothetical protein [Hyphomicrobiales bacterium]
VGAFTDGAPGDNAGDFTAAIDWGDGTTSAGTVTYNGGVYSVSSAGHAYAQAGSYVVSVAVRDDGASSATITGAASIQSADIEGPVSLGFAMDLTNLAALIGPDTGTQNHLNFSTSMGTFTAVGDSDDTFTYSLGSGVDGGGHSYDTTHFSMNSSTGALSTGAATVSAGTYYLDVVATDSDATAHQTSQEVEVYVGSSGGDTQNFSGSSVPVIAYGLGGADSLTGGSSYDYFSGGAGNDALYASNGVLVGNGGADSLTHVGATGSVTFSYVSVADSQAAHGSSHPAVADTINGFVASGSVHDYFDLTAIAGLNQSATFNMVSSLPTTIAADTFDLLTVAGGVDIYANAGTVAETIGAANANDVMLIHVTGVSSLTSSDFNLHA